MAFDWIAGLFQSEQTRGLSGDSASAVALDDSNPYYNYRLRRHKAEGDVVADPGLLWYTSPYVKRRTGLGTHIAAEQGEGIANFTDVLLILSQEDFARAHEGATEPWLQAASRSLAQEFENFCRREQFSRLYSHRQLGFRILCDGSTEMGGQSLGLGAGEFVTGLLPNLYTGPVRGSFPVIGVHLNLPGVWEGYQEVGRLHNDQILFTLGSHWLDNFYHPSLKEAALYRLQQYPDGSFVHIVNPDLQDRYQVTSVQQNGTNVLTLATRDGQPLAYMVLAVIDPPADAPSSPGEESARPGMATPVAPAKPKKRAASVPPDVAPPMLIDDALQPIHVEKTRLGSKTIIPDAPSERIFTLQERGALLQKVHFSAFMEGYDVYMGQRGELGTVVENPAATFQVRKRQVSLKAHIDLLVGGRKVSAGSEVMIEGDTTIEVGSEKLDYRDLRGLRVDGWPYVGEIRRPASSNYMIWGDRYRIGRSRECRVVLPDEPRNDNIHWKASVGAGATIRARTGEIPKSRFYTDSIMVASEHATIDTKADRPEVICNARHCYVYVRRRSEVMPLYPSTSGRTPQQLELEPGDEVLIGNCLFQVGFSPGGSDAPMVPAAPAPDVKLSPDSLVDAVSEPDFADLDQQSKPPLEERMGIEMLEPINPRSTPLDVLSMESVTGASIKAGADREYAKRNSLDDTGPVSMPPIEDDGDEPTSPGMVVPRELLEDDELDDDPLPNDERAVPAGARDPQTVPAGDSQAPGARDSMPASEPPVDPTKDAVAGWDEDDWEEQTGPREMPEESGAPAMGLGGGVPAPFPEVEQAHAASEETVFHEPEDVPAPDSADADAPSETWNPDDPQGEEFSDDAATVVTQRPEVAGVEESSEVETPASDDLDEAEPTEMAVQPPVLDPEPEAEPEPEPEPEAAAPEPPAPVVPSAGDPASDAGDPPSESDEPEGEARGPGEVVYTDDSEAQFELGRPLHIVQSGWTVRGKVVAGNHTGADLVIPENRIVEGQTFEPADYFALKVRGRKGQLDVLRPRELLVNEDDPREETYTDLSALTIDVIRRDDQGEEDFVVRLLVTEDRSLPDPRARFVALDYEDPLAAALVTKGLGIGQPRTLSLGDVEMTLTWSGEALTISDYLASYAGPDGFRPFFVQQDGKRFVTAPEDGSDIVLVSGDRIVVGTSVFLVRGI
ncbi:MAG: hypothetical protein R3F61_27405 [Myxococcota bacterium]